MAGGTWKLDERPKIISKIFSKAERIGSPESYGLIEAQNNDTQEVINMKKWSIAVLALVILAAGAVSVSAASDTTRQTVSPQATSAVSSAALQGCDGIPALDGTGNPYRGTAVSTSGSQNEDGTPNCDGTGAQYHGGNHGGGHCRG